MGNKHKNHNKKAKPRINARDYEGVQYGPIKIGKYSVNPFMPAKIMSEGNMII